MEPRQKKASRMLATCLSVEAISQHDIKLFERADRALTQALDDDWNWEQGHQLQIDLFICFERQGNLIQDYRQKGLTDEARKSISERMIKIIQLTEKFRENPPVVTANLAPDLDLVTVSKKYWFLIIGLPTLLGAVYEIPNLYYSAGEKGSFLTPFVFLVLGIGVLILILV